MPTLNEVLYRLAVQIKADGSELIRYAQEDTIGGYHNEPAHSIWPTGSIWGSEGQILYVLTRHLKPAKVVEIGGWRGCSATHIAKALMANGRGHLWSFDNGTQGGNHGDMIPNELREFVTLVGEDGIKNVQAMEASSVDLLFEDAMHDTPSVLAIALEAKRVLRNGGLLVNHDGAKDFAWAGGGMRVGSRVGVEVRDGLRQAEMKYYEYITEESDCGLTVSVNEKTQEIESVQIDDSPIGNGMDELLKPVHEEFTASVELTEEPPAPEKKTRRRRVGKGKS